MRLAYLQDNARIGYPVTAQRVAVGSPLDDAHAFVDNGVPIFACPLKSNGDPMPPRNWESIAPSHAQVNRWKNGMALCAVTGIVYDVIDIDPRNGGSLSFKRLTKTLGDDGPVVYWEVATASGGTHLWIAPLGIGTRPGFMPGIDLKGGKPDGSSRGFVFIPPTRRPSKDDANAGTLIQYRPTTQQSHPINGSGGNTAAIRAFIETPPLEGKVVTTGRAPVSELKQACLDAPAGSQRAALLRYTHELERKGYEPGDILELLEGLAARMPAYNERKPWRPADLRGLLHKPGEVIPDGAPDEIGKVTTRRASGGLRKISDVERELIHWIWPGRLARGKATLLDGDEGMAKSLITLDVAARFSQGCAMPGETAAHVPAGNVLMLAPEDSPSDIQARWEAAGGDPERLFIPDLQLVKEKGGRQRVKFDGEYLAFPDAIQRFRRWLVEYEIQLVIIDPIMAYLSEKVNSNNDPQVRRALEPLSTALSEFGCAAIMIRHLNKNATYKAAYRGGGSVAFGAVARVRLLVGELPPSAKAEAANGLMIIKNNNLKKASGQALGYDVMDSSVVQDNEGNLVGCIEWGQAVPVSADALLNGDPKQHGFAPERRMAVEAVLTEMFAEKDPWPVAEAKARIASAFADDDQPNHKTLEAARAALGINYRQDKGGRWWTMEPPPKTRVGG